MNYVIGTKEKDFSVKNFSYYSKETGTYHQYLCRLKEQYKTRTVRKLNYLIRNQQKLNLPIETNSVFKTMLGSDVIDFQEFLQLTQASNCDMESVANAATSFLGLFEFGNYREKDANHFGMDILEAVKSTFGCTEKNRRLLREYHSAGYNSQALEISGFEVHNYVGNVKKIKQK